MKNFTIRDNAKKIIRGVCVLLFWLLVWQTAATLIGKEVILPSPLRTIERIWQLSFEQKFYASVGYSLLRIMLGYSVAVLLGLALGIAAYKIELIRALLSPMMTLVKATPVASFIILILLWIKAGLTPSFTAFLMVLPIIYDSTENALLQTDRGLIEMCRVYDFSFTKRLRLLYAPSLAPYFFSSARTSLSLAWKAGIAAEVICTPKLSIGVNLYNSKIYLETVDLFAWTAVIILLSIILEKIILAASKSTSEKRLARYAA